MAQQCHEERVGRRRKLPHASLLLVELCSACPSPQGTDSLRLLLLDSPGSTGQMVHQGLRREHKEANLGTEKVLRKRTDRMMQDRCLAEEKYGRRERDGGGSRRSKPPAPGAGEEQLEEKRQKQGRLERS